MKLVKLREGRAMARFAERAAEHFHAHPAHYTFADGDPEAGELLAIRWNCATVMIIKPEDDPVLYDSEELIGESLPPITCWK
jgi:hypothetical protein